MDITYDSIKSLIKAEELDGQMIKLKFQAINQDTPMETVAVVMADQNEIMKNAMKQAGKSAAINAGVSTASRALGGMIGGVAGSIASSAGSAAGSHLSSNSMDPQSMMQTEITQEKIEAAIVQAFSNLQMYYEYVDGEWKYKVPSV